MFALQPQDNHIAMIAIDSPAGNGTSFHLFTYLLKQNKCTSHLLSLLSFQGMRLDARNSFTEPPTDLHEIIPGGPGKCAAWKSKS